MMNISPSTHTRPRSFWIILGLLVLAIVLVFLRGLPSWPLRADDPPQRFSAYRALDDLKVVFGEDGSPHPTGSATHDQVALRLAARLESLGYTPEVQETTACRPYNGTNANCATVTNVLARLDGVLGGQALMLATHYDSVPAGPGIADDAAGTAAQLEIARILRSAPQPYRNPVIFLFTDAEELYSLGAQGFVDEHPWARQVAVVINLEARGTSGESLMFETSPGNEWLMEAVSAARRPATSSLMVDAYGLMSSSTDLSVFMQAGMAGLNYAFTANSTRYHTPQDNLENLSLGSLQHQGDSVLAAAQTLAAMDLTRPSDAAPDAAYMDLLGFGLLSFPRAWVLPLSVVLVLLLAAGLGFVYWRERQRLFVDRVEGPVQSPVPQASAPVEEQAALKPAGEVVEPVQPGEPASPQAGVLPEPAEDRTAVPAVLHLENMLIARPEPPQPGEPAPVPEPAEAVVEPAPAEQAAAVPPAAPLEAERSMQPHAPRRVFNARPLQAVGWGLLAAFLTVLLSALLGWGLASLVPALKGEPAPWHAYPIFMRLALWSLPLFLAALAAWLFARRTGGVDLALGVWSLWALLGLVAAVAMPGAAIYLLVPTLVAAVLLLVLMLSGLHRSPLAREIAFAIPALLSVLLLARLVVQFETVVSFSMPYVITLCLGLAAAAFLPLFDLPPGQTLPRRWLILGVGGLLGLALVAAILVPTYSTARPQPLNFYYLADLDAGTTRWTTFETLETLPLSLRETFSQEGAARLENIYPWWGDAGWLLPVAPAPAFAGDVGELEILSDITYEGGTRVIILAVHTQAPEVDLIIPVETLASVQVGEKELFDDVTEPWDGMYYLQCSGHCEGFEVRLAFNAPRDSAAKPLTVYLREVSLGLPAAAGAEAGLALPPRPAITMPIHAGDQTVVWKSFDL